MAAGFCHCPSPNTIAAVIGKITASRTSVAIFEGIPATPIFPKIFVNAAKTAERTANPSHPERSFTPSPPLLLPFLRETLRPRAVKNYFPASIFASVFKSYFSPGFNKTYSSSAFAGASRLS